VSTAINTLMSLCAGVTAVQSCHYKTTSIFHIAKTKRDISKYFQKHRVGNICVWYLPGNLSGLFLPSVHIKMCSCASISLDVFQN